MSLFGSWELAMTIEITTPFVKSSAIKNFTEVEMQFSPF